MIVKGIVGGGSESRAQDAAIWLDFVVSARNSWGLYKSDYTGWKIMDIHSWASSAVLGILGNKNTEVPLGDLIQRPLKFHLGTPMTGWSTNGPA